eukprot:UN33989
MMELISVSPIINSKFRLYFQHIPKVACSTFKRLMCKMDDDCPNDLLSEQTS